MQLGNRTIRTFAALALITALGAACGDDDDDDAADTTTTTEAEDDTTSTTEGDGEVNPEFAEYCGLSAELDEQEDFPTEEQLTELRDAAPDEIADEAEIVVAGLIEAIEAGTPEAGFANPDVTSNLEVIEAFEEENCGRDDVDTPDPADIDPEFAEYCAISIELDQQEAFPTEEQLNEIRDVAPDEIRENIEYVVDAFLTAMAETGTAEAAFQDPGIDENFMPIEEFDAEHCGLNAED